MRGEEWLRLVFAGRHGVHGNAVSRRRHKGHKADREMEARLDDDGGIKSVGRWVAGAVRCCGGRVVADRGPEEVGRRDVSAEH